MQWIAETFRHYPELAVFLTLALGYWVGGLKAGSFSLGSVTGVLLMGVVVGQLDITISPNVKSIFFLMFLFAVGYGVGPQFFKGLGSDGLPQAMFAVLQCVVSLLSAYVIAKLLRYDAGGAAGLLSGSQTISAVLGVATDAINRIDMPAEQRAAMINHMPVAYAVTYLFGTAGSAWLLASLGPRLLRVDLAAECKALEAQMGQTEHEPGVISAARRFDVRAYRITERSLDGTTVADLEARLAATRTSVERIRHDGKIVAAEPTTVIHVGDVLAVVGRREVLVEGALGLGSEVEDRELLDFPAEILDVVVTNKEFAGRTIQDLAESASGRAQVRGVYLRSLTRAGQEMPFTPGTVVDRGDVLQIVGAKRNVERAAATIGYADRQTDVTDMVIVGAGIVLGGLLGALAVTVRGIPLSLSTSGGALIAGLVFGWLRAVDRRFGRIPAPALWVLNNLGLTAFIAVVGISAGPSFVAGLKEAGMSLFVAGVVVTSVPLIVGVLVARHLFGMHPGIALGAAAGARTTTAALGLIEDAAHSKVPALGYTVPYAVGNTLLTIWGLVIVLLMQ
ncbi:MAG: aspartate-alanine antiporter [Deltaproteobacteria bacterium]|nr:MAG: aspartate-alanine antiporter [Deltaproteobacteria bacterium]